MHWLMSFVGSVPKLMANSSLEKLMDSAFAGVSKMPIRNKFPVKVKVLRVVVSELLCLLVDEMVDGYDDLIFFLESLAVRNYFAKHWVNNLIKPFLIMMLYVQAEGEAEFSLHLYASKQMFHY